MLNPNFVYIGALIGSIGSIAYIIGTLKGTIQPHRVSFLLWAIAPFIAFAAQVQQGVGIESVMTFSFGFFPLLIFIASFVNKKATWNASKFDLVCGGLSILGLLMWQITKVGNVAIFFSILADALAAIPTLIKAYKYPETEEGWPWLTTWFGSILALFTVSTITFANSGFTIYVIIVNTFIFSLIHFKIGERFGFKNIVKNTNE